VDSTPQRFRRSHDRFGIGLAIAFFWKRVSFLALTAFAIRSGIRQT
jgi:ABC-type uncharacterized transport system YnjBCD permease subunit